MNYKEHLKIPLDILMALTMGTLLSPLLIVVYLVLLVTQGYPVFYTQMRSGKDRRKFNLYKFRTLKPRSSNNLGMEHREYSLLGNTLRQLGIDELPQLLNIIKGEMSFIGPRPMPVEYESKYNHEQSKRFLVKPGITGWAQVNGRNDISWGRRFELDLWYVSNVSFVLDAKIIWMTIFQIMTCVFRQNKNHTEMEVFKGSNLR